MWFLFGDAWGLFTIQACLFLFLGLFKMILDVFDCFVGEINWKGMCFLLDGLYKITLYYIYIYVCV